MRHQVLYISRSQWYKFSTDICKDGVSNADRIYIADNNQYFTNSSSAYNIVRRSDDGGANWTTIRSQGRNTWPPVTDLAVNPGNSLEIWLTYGGFSAGSKVFYSSDGGDNWTNVTGTLPNVPINCVIYGDDANNTNDPVYIGTDIGVFIKTIHWVTGFRSAMGFRLQK